MPDKTPRELHRIKLELLKELEKQIKKSDVQKAVETAREYSRLFPESAYPHLVIAKMYHERCDYSRAFECYNLAEQTLDNLIETKPENMPFYLQTIVNLVTTAVMQYVQNNDVSLVEKMVGEGYRNGELYFALGKVAFEKRDYGKTRELMDKAILDKKLLENLVTDAHIFRGLSNIALDNVGEGEKDLQTAETRNPKKRRLILESKAEMYESKGLYKQSLDSLFGRDFGFDLLGPDDLVPN